MCISFNKSASLIVIYDPANVRISVSNKLVQGLIVGGAAPPNPPPPWPTTEEDCM